MNYSVRSLIDNALDHPAQTQDQYQSYEADYGYMDGDTIKLAHALDYVSSNLDNIGTMEEKIAELQMLQEKVANELAAIPPPTPATTAGYIPTANENYAFESGKKTGTQTTGISQAIKNTWQGTGPKWTSAMGGHAGKLALGAGALGLGVLGASALKKEGSYGLSYEDLQYLNTDELISLGGFDDDDLYVMNKVAGLRGTSLHELLLEKVADVDNSRISKLDSMLGQLSSGDSKTLTQTQINMLKRRLALVPANELADSYGQSIKKQIEALSPDKPFTYDRPSQNAQESLRRDAEYRRAREARQARQATQATQVPPGGGRVPPGGGGNVPPSRGGGIGPYTGGGIGPYTGAPSGGGPGTNIGPYTGGGGNVPPRGPAPSRALPAPAPAPAPAPSTANVRGASKSLLRNPYFLGAGILGAGYIGKKLYDNRG